MVLTFDDQNITAVVFASLLVALVVVLAAARRQLGKWLHFIGSATFNFSESWASTITLVGAFFGTMLGSKALPENGPAETFAGLSLLFGVLTLLAPLVYQAFGGRLMAREPAPAEMVYVGRVGGFIAAAFLTTWAVLGQLGAIVLLLLPELEEETLPASAALVFQVFLLVGLGLVVLYVGKTIPWVIEHQSDPTSDGLMARDNQLRREWSLM